LSRQGGRETKKGRQNARKKGRGKKEREEKFPIHAASVLMRHTKENVSKNRTIKTHFYSSILLPQVPV
jgi:hypothetical protein